MVYKYYISIEAVADQAMARTKLLWPHRVSKMTSPPEHWRDPPPEVVWCAERFGQNAATIYVQETDRTLYLDSNLLWLYTGVAFHFRESDHAIEFKLRWA